ncbi:glutamic-type intramembrane protease PrsW [Anaerobacillus isosaccharinicus]|uniref:Protease PrsW n=1 Tax=Anaerobacillus isosaccharinicus TaxID=1532552 RepID=A0A1S2M458_9BACI|nr:glutamic-type intramembrane protease PrsW [Anaerobacillus isosaccharinicus]MBA5585823.1 intramembrane metalloprotease PrsW [Anaerobacillus isosaccharinicus]QOY35880.1 intramembrane metalloprotease PrsW [Anaerobacillus isosaccharinicus]
MISIIFASLAPSLALLCFFYLKDNYNSEPLGMVFRSFIFGVLLVFPILVIQYAFQEEGLLISPLSQAFISAALFEEFFKWFILFYTVYKHAVFNDPYDGIVYGVSVSLGFATMENVFFLLAYGVDLAFIRALLPVSSHALFGVIMGYYLGKAKFGEKRQQRKLLFFSLLIPWVLHGIYDYILYVQRYWIYMMLPFMIFLWWLALKKVKLANKKTVNDENVKNLY